MATQNTARLQQIAKEGVNSHGSRLAAIEAIQKRIAELEGAGARMERIQWLWDVVVAIECLPDDVEITTPDDPEWPRASWRREREQGRAARQDYPTWLAEQRALRGQSDAIALVSFFGSRRAAIAATHRDIEWFSREGDPLGRLPWLRESLAHLEAMDTEGVGA